MFSADRPRRARRELRVGKPERSPHRIGDRGTGCEAQRTFRQRDGFRQQVNLIDTTCMVRLKKAGNVCIVWKCVSPRCSLSCHPLCLRALPNSRHSGSPQKQTTRQQGQKYARKPVRVRS